MKPQTKNPFEALMITYNRVMIKAPKGAHSFLLSFLCEKERIKKEMKEKKR